MLDNLWFRDPVQDPEAFKRREEEALQITLRCKYMADPEEMEYWASLEPSPEFEPLTESDEPFSTQFERHESEPQTLSEFIHFGKYGYFLRVKDGTTITKD